MTSTEIASASKIILGTTEAVAMYIGSEQLWPVDLHEYVEIDGLKWATMNIGASSVTDKGLLYAWGETEGYNNYNDPPFWSAYKYGNGTQTSHTESDMTKYNSTDGKTVLDPEDDAATANWGGRWRMPSIEEWESLVNNTNQEYTNNYNNSGVKGWLCTDKTDSNKKLFFPVNVELKIPGSGTYFMGFYYSNLLYIEDKTQAFRTGFRSSGVFTQEHSSRYIVNGVRAVIPHDYSLDYFTIESLEDSNLIKIGKNKSPSNINLSYSTDDGETWTDLTLSAGRYLTTINTGDKIIFKGINNRLATAWDTYYRFYSTKNIKVYGNAMSLLNGNNFVSNSTLDSSGYNLCGLFYGTTTLVDASNLMLPATTLYTSSYNGMFRGCSNLVYGPKLLPALDVPVDGYSSMFEGCTSLVEAPEILATTVSGNTALSRMFCMNRNSKVTAAMTKGPVLRITNPGSYNNVYQQLFCGNGNIVEITVLINGTDKSFANWLNNVSSTGVIKTLSGTTFASGASGLPSGWTVEDYVEP